MTFEHSTAWNPDVRAYDERTRASVDKAVAELRADWVAPAEEDDDEDEARG